MNGEPVMVMLVEDNMDHAELVMRTLEDHSIANWIRHFTDGQSALDYLLRQGEFLDPAASPLSACDPARFAPTPCRWLASVGGY